MSAADDITRLVLFLTASSPAKRSAPMHGFVQMPHYAVLWLVDPVAASYPEASISRRGNCHDNAVAKSFFQLLKRIRIGRRTYATQEDARRHVFEDIGMFRNS